MTICISDNFFELVIYRKRIKYAYLRVKPNKVIVVSAPEKMSDDLIIDMIKSRERWIISVSNTLEDDYKNEDSIKLMPVPENQMLEVKYNAEEAAFDSLERMYPLVKTLGISMPEVRVRYMTSRWGSCIYGKSKIWINVYLVKLPEECMDYVVLHELVHFIHPNHGKGFYDILTKLMPDWKRRRDILRKVHLPSKNARNEASYINGL